MEANHRTYDHLASFSRIDGYLDANDSDYEEVERIPSRDKLTYSNGFYIQHCSALFVDIRKSSTLAEKYTRPRLAKLYRSYVSEVVAILNDATNCAEINIVGDGVCGIFDTPLKSDIDAVFEIGARIQSVIDVLNSKLTKRGMDQIQCGIGIDYGRLLMVQAGSSGSGINDVVWMGSAVNGAAHLSNSGSREYYDKPLMVSSVIYNNLKDDYKNFLIYNSYRQCYHGYVVNVTMKEWLDENQ